MTSAFGKVCKIGVMHGKMDKNEKKYPVEKAYGKSTKYNKL